MDATQVASFILEHRHSLQELNLEDVVLRSGTWDEALAPLTRLSGSGRWKEKQHDRSFVDVPIVLSPAGVSRQQLQNVIRAVQRDRGRLGGLIAERSRAHDPFWGNPDHMKRLLPVVWHARCWEPRRERMCMGAVSVSQRIPDLCNCASVPSIGVQARVHVESVRPGRIRIIE